MVFGIIMFFITGIAVLIGGVLLCIMGEIIAGITAIFLGVLALGMVISIVQLWD